MAVPAPAVGTHACGAPVEGCARMLDVGSWQRYAGGEWETERERGRVEGLAARKGTTALSEWLWFMGGDRAAVGYWGCQSGCVAWKGRPAIPPRKLCRKSSMEAAREKKPDIISSSSPPPRASIGLINALFRILSPSLLLPLLLCVAIPAYTPIPAPLPLPLRLPASSSSPQCSPCLRLHHILS